MLPRVAPMRLMLDRLFPNRSKAVMTRLPPKLVNTRSRKNLSTSVGTLHFLLRDSPHVRNSCISHACRREFEALENQEKARISRLRGAATLCGSARSYFMGEVEAVFGIWLVPLFIAMLF